MKRPFAKKRISTEKARSDIIPRFVHLLRVRYERTQQISRFFFRLKFGKRAFCLSNDEKGLFIDV